MTDETRTINTLRELQAMNLNAKILLTKARIREFYERMNGDVYVSFSGGKDSTVLLDIVRKMYPNVKAVFSDTGLEYPEIREFVTKHQNVDIVKPDINFKKVVLTVGYPVFSKQIAHTVGVAKRNPDGKMMKNYFVEPKKSIYNCSKYRYLLDAPFNVSDQCCYIMKKKPMNTYTKKTGLYPIIATMAVESNMRRDQWVRQGCNIYGNKPHSAPMSFWTEQDVFEYITENDIPIASVYGEIFQDERGKYKTTGVDRTGCMFCGFGAHLEKAPNRFERMKQTHPKQWNFCMKPIEDGGLGMKTVLDYCGIRTGAKIENDKNRIN